MTIHHCEYCGVEEGKFHIKGCKMTLLPEIKCNSNFVPAALKELANIYGERNAAYGDSYHTFGKVLAELYPDGITLHGIDDFNRFVCYFQALGKLVRYAPNFHKGGHIDSLDDCSVYCQMLQQLDFEMNSEKRKEENAK